MYECKICNKPYEKKTSLAQHVRAAHKILIYDYYKEYDKKEIICAACHKIRENSKIHFKYCNDPLCSKMKFRLCLYRREADHFKVYDPFYWLTFFNHDVKKTIEHLDYLIYFQRYLKTKKIYSWFEKENLLTEWDSFIDRIITRKLNIDILKKETNSTAKERWSVLGFPDIVYVKIKKYFLTDKQSFSLRHGKEKCEEYYNSLSTNRKPFKPENSFLCVPYWTNKGMTVEQAKERISKICTRNLPYFVSKYGEEKGKEVYEKMLHRRSIAYSLQTKQEKYGIVEGLRIYREIIDKKTNHIPNIQSKRSLDFLNDIMNTLPQPISCECEKTISWFVSDFYFPQYSTVIEYYGDYWHKNKYLHHKWTQEQLDDESNKHNFRTRTVLTDARCKKIIILWERAYVHLPHYCLENIVRFMKADTTSNYLELNIENNSLQISERIF